MAVFVLDKRHAPLMPCSEKRARQLLRADRARVHRLMPFTIRLTDRLAADSVVQPLRVKLDPGSKATGVALVRDMPGHAAAVISLMELQHRGEQIKLALRARAALRRGRRGRKTRYRAPRFLNRVKPAGWLPPNLRHRVDTAMAWVRRLTRLAPVAQLSVERVKFDMQLINNPAIAGAEYQRGTLYGFELREYILTRDSHQCVYCDARDKVFNLDHVRARANGFPRGYLTRQKRVHGFATGDQVLAVVATGKKAGTYTGRVAVRASGSFNIKTATGLVQGISHKYCRVLQRGDGYGYLQIRATAKASTAAQSPLYLPGLNAGVSRGL